MHIYMFTRYLGDYGWSFLLSSAISVIVGNKDGDRFFPAVFPWCTLSESVKKMEKQRNLDAQNLKAQLDSIHDVLDTKVPFWLPWVVGKMVKAMGFS